MTPATFTINIVRVGGWPGAGHLLAYSIQRFSQQHGVRHTETMITSDKLSPVWALVASVTDAAGGLVWWGECPGRCPPADCHPLTCLQRQDSGKLRRCEIVAPPGHWRGATMARRPTGPRQSWAGTLESGARDSHQHPDPGRRHCDTVTPGQEADCRHRGEIKLTWGGSPAVTTLCNAHVAPCKPRLSGWEHLYIQL